MSDLLTREFTVRATGAPESREVTGIAVPYGQIIQRYDAEYGTDYEMFAPGAVKNHPDGVMYLYGHAEPIGLELASVDVEGGHEVTNRISDTARGREVHTLLKDRVLTKHSIGFYPVEAHIEKVRLDPADENSPEVDVLVRTEVLKREVSVVPFPAYSKADITEVRDREPGTSRKDTRMPDAPETLTRADLAEVTEHVTKIERQMAVLAESGGDAREDSPILEYRSHGEFLKALATGEARDHVEALNRAFADTGNVVGDVSPGVRPTWVDRDVKLVETRRPIVNLFNRDALPGEGMSITYPVFDAKTGDVARQSTEAAALNLLKLKIKNATANVTTEGGAAELSKQVIDRMPASYLSKVLQMIKISYGKNTNNIVRAALLAVPTTGTGASNAAIDISGFATKAAAYVGAMIDATDAIEENSLGLGLDFVLCNKTQFKNLATLVDLDERLQFSVAGTPGSAVNAVGSVNVKALSINVGGVPWVLDPGMAANANARACSAEALTVLESPGAPFQLTDENVINLTEAFSMYGYIATTVDDPKGIVPIKTAA
ncbi:MULTISPECIES: HK97 family phage prohead protease [unclassified Aeromicrobium]|uniref:HK97 family phage prohead protease n=1 Tax=unclassified Aeromicrobium TaxID=2633570 RepID=UPI00288A393B|nr:MULTISPECIES: HK97 family phage prohead protease [unclassified Aeromicrobium]